jgi:hypothetical protein
MRVLLVCVNALLVVSGRIRMNSTQLVRIKEDSVAVLLSHLSARPSFSPLPRPLCTGAVSYSHHRKLNS